MNKFLKRVWVFLAFFIIMSAILSGFVRALTPWATQYKYVFERYLSSLIGEPVSIRSMNTGWYWFEPIIQLNHIEVFNQSKLALKVKQVAVGINLFRSLWHWQVQPGVLFIDDSHINLYQTENGWHLGGFPQRYTSLDEENLAPLLAWVLGQQKIILKNLSAHIYLQSGGLIPLSHLNIATIKRNDRYRVKIKARLKQTITTQFESVATLKFNPKNHYAAEGEVYFFSHDILPTQWQRVLPASRFQLEGGKGDVRLWLNFKDNELTQLQSTVHFHHLVIADKKRNKEQFIPSLRGNLAWTPTKEGWQFSADQLKLRLGSVNWPENTILVRYERDKNYFVYIKNILIDSLFSSEILRSMLLEASTEGEKNRIIKLLTAKPRGQLHDTQLKIVNKRLDYFLTQFSQLSWLPSPPYPGLNHLFGVLQWEPNEGHLEIEGKKIKLISNKHPPETFAFLNAGFDWKKLNQGLRVSMDHFVISHPNLTLSAQGVADELNTSIGALSLQAKFSAKHAERWLSFLPSSYIKPKLDKWLKKDVKEINRMSGEITIKGNMEDFPFDKKPGVFSIRSYLSGVALNFAPHWPLVKGIEAYLDINKRTLEANIIQANFLDVLINKANLSVSNLGLDKEVLLARTQVATLSKNALAYVRQSPLNKKLTVLNRLDMQGPLALDLQLEVPLYAGNDDVLVLGQVNLHQNNIQIHHHLGDIALNSLTGDLEFDQSGVIKSNFDGKILDTPINLKIQSKEKPAPKTEVRLSGQIGIAKLQDKITFPIPSFLHGSLKVESVLDLTENNPNKVEQLHIASSLEGLGIDLPFPLGKSTQEILPLTINLTFDPEKNITMAFDYRHYMHAKFKFAPLKNEFSLKKGSILLGEAKPLKSQQPGLEILGEIPEFDFQQWLSVISQLTKATGKNLPSLLNYLDIKLHKATIFNEIYNNLEVKLGRVKKEEWKIDLKQKDILAKFHYNTASNTIKGAASKLYLNYDNSRPIQRQIFSHLKPANIPNIDLHIDSLYLNQLSLGEITLKTSSSLHRLEVQQCKIKSAYYQLLIKGDWIDVVSKPRTSFQADIEIKNLAKSLENFKISPVVEANRGLVHVQGKWPGAIYDFSLPKIKGEMIISLKNGRITHLSPEAEEKLGLGKLLSILSLQTIPRRLTLDFSDLSEDGYSFDEFHGNFSFSKGMMFTQNSYIDGPVAYANMKGNLDIAKQYYDLDLRVNPHITASLPVVATLAGGPIAGMATWVASKLINQSMQRISGYTYKVTGPWKAPVVQQIKIIKNKRTQF